MCPDSSAVTPRPPPSMSGFHITLSKLSDLLTDERRARLRAELTGQCLTGCTRGLVVLIFLCPAAPLQQDAHSLTTGLHNSVVTHNQNKPEPHTHTQPHTHNHTYKGFQ